MLFFFLSVRYFCRVSMCLVSLFLSVPSFLIPSNLIFGPTVLDCVFQKAYQVCSRHGTGIFWHQETEIYKNKMRLTRVGRIQWRFDIAFGKRGCC